MVLARVNVPGCGRALQSTQAILAKVEPSHLDAPTPCAAWNVRALINHFVGTTRWWASTVTGEGGVADADYAAGDFVAAYEESSRIALAVFEADGVPGRAVRLPVGEFPGAVALAQHVLPAPAGQVGTHSGPFFSAADSMRVTVHGRGGHGDAAGNR